MALKRLYGLEARFKREPYLKNEIGRQIQDYLTKGYARICTPHELALSNRREWYLPIFPALNPNKPGKVRIVFDAKAQVNGISLNSELLKGPTQSSTLLEILLRFRQRKVAITGDIREMFHQVKIHHEDQVAQRFLWRHNEREEPSTYVLQVMTFGATCFPSCAQFVKNTNAKRFEETHIRAVEAIIANHYVDDLLDCTDTIEETIELAMNVRQIHSEANFEIRNWRSNCPAVLEALGSLNTNSTNLNMNMNREDEIEKVLGMWWCYVDDEFTFSLKYNKGNENIRQM